MMNFQKNSYKTRAKSQKSQKISTLSDILADRVQHHGEKTGYIFLEDGERELSHLTYQALETKAKAIATTLQACTQPGDRALLLYHPGPEFLMAFFGCLYAGVIAVPVYPSHSHRNLRRLESIIADAQVNLVLTTQSLVNKLENHWIEQPSFHHLQWLTTETINTDLAAAWKRPDISQDTIAFLQYTSGSTGTPKGVMVSHHNLLNNERLLEMALGHSQRTVVAGWLPLFHVIGLVGNIIQPLYLGVPSILMSPNAFIQKPIRWLEVITRYGVTTSGGPNFAYDLCVKKITPEQLETLNLSGWELAFTGAEPIREQTMEQFAQKFAPCGFRKTAFYPCYGMAEATLFITGGLASQVPVVKTVDDKALTEDRVVEVSREQTHAVTLVGCGGACLGQTVKIVNPQTLTECDNNQVGEIWVSGDSVAKGYWREPQKTKDTFAAYLTDTGEGPFLRTGDLGFFSEDLELFVTGRLKDVIIIRGRNHYPQDIESTVEQCHGAVVNHRSAAFTVQVNGTDQLMVTAELERRYHQRRQHTASVSPGQERRKGERRQESEDPGFEVAPPPSHPPIFDEIVSSIKQAVCRHHGLQVYRVLLLRVGTIPKTSSGKIQRYACREGLLNDSLNVVFDSKP